MRVRFLECTTWSCWLGSSSAQTNRDPRATAMNGSSSGRAATSYDPVWSRLSLCSTCCSILSISLASKVQEWCGSSVCRCTDELINSFTEGGAWRWARVAGLPATGSAAPFFWFMKVGVNPLSLLSLININLKIKAAAALPLFCPSLLMYPVVVSNKD